jgi:hypothetical protein
VAEFAQIIPGYFHGRSGPPEGGPYETKTWRTWVWNSSSVLRAVRRMLSCNGDEEKDCGVAERARIEF